jgi:stress response protein SCP2
MNKPMEIDCDASAVLLNRDKRPVSKEMTESVLNYQNSRMFDEAALHLGDNTKGELADDEVIVLDLDRIPGEV